MCLSSRPLLAFEDGFGKYPNLKLQNLTQNDIKLYTDIELAKSPRFEILKMREPKRAPELVTEIVDKSAGVFLWVTLVVKSLLEGLQNSDRISDLQKRLRALPAGLEDLYLLMMNTLDKFYQQQASQLFQIVHRARLPLSVLSLSFADDDEDPEFAIRAKLDPLDEKELSWRYEETVRRVNSRCKGLLEVRVSSDKERLVDSKVDFLHRTVKDFLDTPDIWKTIASQSDPSFNPDISLMRSYLVQMKVLNTLQWDVGTFGLLAGEFMEYAAQAERTSGQVQASLMENFCQTATDLWFNWTVTSNRTVYHKEGSYAWVKVVPHVHQFVYDSQPSFLSLAVSYGLDLYVEWKLDQDAQPVKTRLGRPLLNYAAAPKPREIWGSRPRNPKLIAILLKYGADPNLEFGNNTTWTDVLQYCYENDGLRPLKSGDRQELFLPVLETMKLLKLEAKVGRRRANEIEKHWEQTPQELRRQAERLDQMEKEKRVRDAQLKEEQAEELAVLYGKKIRPTAKEDDIFSGIDQEPVMIIKFPWEESESLPQTPEEKPAVLIIPKKKRWSSNLRNTKE
ncbi:uncharacterized protein K444DRAFT_636826 [Hyaloscypha bicolor E]|uniref:DUF7791 domain-containing protein n=1 Tax=Hyaloscypha bicolor E TaxID=1095630 RepID=A0A2J6SLA8_9HELO|nr:uncharacterized protein K444DRAFT_636826 [Hyaloscypha bicolor E]PMD51544.1 hypothetical protein K444DRAFT_636826 [Hyaloscypha bicolor E]